MGSVDHPHRPAVLHDQRGDDDGQRQRHGGGAEVRRGEEPVVELDGWGVQLEDCAGRADAEDECVEGGGWGSQV